MPWGETRLQALSCPACGAPLPAPALADDVATCPHCNSVFRVPSSQTPQPTLGDLILGADFRDPQVPGWTVYDRDKLEFRPGEPPEMVVRFPASNRNHTLLRSPGPLDDYDASVTIRFLEGTYTHIKAGLEIRAGDHGDYLINISAQATYRIAYHVGNEWGGELLDWTSHPALRKELGERNRLRVVVRGNQLRVYLNGVLATSLRDDRYSFGFLRLVLSPGEQAPMLVAFSDLQVREAPPE